MNEGNLEKYELVTDDSIGDDYADLMNFVEEIMEERDEFEEEGGADDVEQQMEALFVGEQRVNTIELENISDSELEGPESGECETSDGELPDSPKAAPAPAPPPVVVVEESPIAMVVSDDEVEVVEHVLSPRKKSPVKEEREKSLTKSAEKNVMSGSRRVSLLKGSTLFKPGNSASQMKQDPHEENERKKSPSKSGKRHHSPIKMTGVTESNTDKQTTAHMIIEQKKKMKLKKYMAKVMQYKRKALGLVGKVTNKCQKLAPSKSMTKVQNEFNKNKSVVEEPTKVKLVVVDPARETFVNIAEQPSNSSKSSIVILDDLDDPGAIKQRLSPSRSKFDKHAKNKLPKDSKEHKKKQYSDNLYHENKTEKLTLSPEKTKSKSKGKSKKIKSNSPEKYKNETRVHPPVLSYLECCEDASPSKNSPTTTAVEPEVRKERTVSSDSGVTTSSLRSENVDSVDDHEDNDLFITISKLVEQDKKKRIPKETEKKAEPGDAEEAETAGDKDPELISFSVFTKVLFKDDEPGIPFLQSGPSSPPKQERAPAPKRFVEAADDADNIYGCVESPTASRLVSPKAQVHNKALLNFVESQKKLKSHRKKPKKSSNSSRSRSKSPKREKSKSKKRKKHHHSSMSVSSSSPHLSPDRLRRPSPRSPRPSSYRGERSVTPPLAGYRKRGSITPPPVYRKRGSVTPPPGYRKRGSVSPPPGYRKRGSVTPPPGYRKRGSVTPPPGYRKRDSLTPPPATRRRGSVTPPPGYRKRDSLTPPPATRKHSPGTSPSRKPSPDRLRERWKDHRHRHHHSHPHRPRRRSRSRHRLRAHSRSRSSSRERPPLYRSRPLRSRSPPPRSPLPLPRSRTRSRSRSQTRSLEEDENMGQENRKKRLKEHHMREIDNIRVSKRMQSSASADVMSSTPVTVKFNPVGLDSFEASRQDNYDPVGMSEVRGEPHTMPQVVYQPNVPPPPVTSYHYPPPPYPQQPLLEPSLYYTPSAYPTLHQTYY